MLIELECLYEGGVYCVEAETIEEGEWVVWHNIYEGKTVEVTEDPSWRIHTAIEMETDEYVHLGGKRLEAIEKQLNEYWEYSEPWNDW